MYWYLDQSLTRVFYKTKMKIFVFWLILYLMMFGLYWAQPQTLTSMKSLHSSDTARHRIKLAVSSLEGKSDRSSQEWSSIYLRKTLGRNKSRLSRSRGWSSGPPLWRTKWAARWRWLSWLLWAFCCDCISPAEDATVTSAKCDDLTVWCNNERRNPGLQETYHLITPPDNIINIWQITLFSLSMTW